MGKERWEYGIKYKLIKKISNKLIYKMSMIEFRRGLIIYMIKFMNIE